MKENYGERIGIAAASIPKEFRAAKGPRTAIVLGSGLSGIAKGMGLKELPYAAIAGYPKPTVAGHAGVMYLSEKTIVCAGRFHYYEGFSMDDVVFPVFLLKELGVTNLVLTNAAGAVNEKYSPGDLVLIKDHLNLLGTNPFIGPNPAKADGTAMGERFFDMSAVWDRDLRRLARESSLTKMRSGVYAAMTGPSYETPAEIGMLRTLGADLVGMSTVPEAIAASYLGMRLLGISCVTNMAAGISKRPLNHVEVTEAGKRAESELRDLLLGILKRL
jgi:purine-nucleoside phosphorylase